MTVRSDAADFVATRTHWHCGSRRLNGEPGDDLLFGPGKSLPCRTGYGAGSLSIPPGQSPWLTARQARWRSPTRTGKRKNSPGTGRRFGSIWLTAHWTIDHISHLYDDGIAAGSDHALVIADLAAA